MEFRNQFTLEGSPDEVIEKFSDVPLMASFLPGASVEPMQSNGNYPAMLVVTFGPKRLSFKGSLTQSIDRVERTGQITGTANGEVRGQRMAVKLTYVLTPVVIPGGAAGTHVQMVSDAQLTGALAEFAKTGGVVVSEALLGEFVKRFGEYMKSTDSGGAFSSPAVGGNALSTTALLGAMWRSLWCRIKDSASRKSKLPADSSTPPNPKKD